jgi:hypothetical protein
MKTSFLKLIVYLSYGVKGKPAMKGQRENRRITLILSLTSSLDGGGLLKPCPGHITNITHPKRYNS